MNDETREDDMAHEPHEPDEPGDLDDVDGEENEIDDLAHSGPTPPRSDTEPVNHEGVLPTPTHRVARMNLNTINLRTGGFAWFSA
jgi:hypothetical protein